jgi:hypothetical protein
MALHGTAETIRGVASSVVFSLPVDFALFTLGYDYQPDEQHPTYSLVADLYTLISIAKQAGEAPVSKPTYTYVESQRYHLEQKVAGTGLEDDASLGIDEKMRAAPICLCMFMLASVLLSGSEPPQHDFLSTNSSQLRALLSTTGTGTEHHTVWTRFPGALLWCLTIGVRFADQTDKTWFPMQFMKTAHP